MRCLIAVAALLAALPAHAISITNLDTQTHQIVLAEVRGSKITRSVSEGATVHIAAAKGRIHLQAKPEQVMQIDYLDRLVIWPEGNLQIQMRRKSVQGR